MDSVAMSGCEFLPGSLTALVLAAFDATCFFLRPTDTSIFLRVQYSYSSPCVPTCVPLQTHTGA